MKPKKIRQGIVTVCGHVDHGKTSILDKLRESSIQKGEAGGITQKISFTLFPLSQLKAVCPLIEKKEIRLDIPGFLFVDTPGHAAFTNLRKRGGGLADLALLVIDINEGIKPQTAEVIQILKMNKTPFLIALNKIDNISGWQTHDKENLDLKKRIELQQENVKQTFNEKYFTLIGSLNNYGFDADLFYNIKDFTKKIALVPCSAKTGEGISELIFILCGLSQRYLQDRLSLGKDAKGVVLEVKKEKEVNYIESILYGGELSRKDEIAVSNLDGQPMISKIRILEEILPLSTRFKPKEKIQASTGLRMQLIEKFEILPGMPFVVYNKNLEQIKENFKKELGENLNAMLSKQGIIAKADSLGSLEALLVTLKQNHIPIVKAGIGKINKTDIASAKANLKINELDAIIVGFNVSADEEAKEITKIGDAKEIKILTDDVIYKLIENLIEFRDARRKEIEKRRLMQLASLCKIKILPQYVFRNTNPAIFGVKVEVGKLIKGLNLVDDKGEKVGKIKNIQSENKSIEEAQEGQEIAISIPGTNFERKLKDKNFLYSDITESQFKNFKKNKDLLTSKEISLLQEIAEIKRQEKADWGFKS
jgi:translation initiation factor 5B